MAQSISIAETNVAANAFTENLPAVNDSPFNPVERTSKVSVYAVTTIAGGLQYGLQIGGVSHGLANGILNAALALSTRDNKILEGIAFRGQKVSVSRRELTAVATTDSEGMVIIEPL